MTRRDFLISAGVIFAFSSVPFLRKLSSPKPLTLTNAYSLWYNRPAVAELDGGFCVGYVTSSGEVTVAEITNDLLIRRTAKLHKFSDSSDHGSPSLIKIPSGKYAGRVLACFSNHASPMLSIRSKSQNDAWSWGEANVIDSGRATYASLAALPDGRVLLMYTLQERIGQYSNGEWRRVVSRYTRDGGDSWSDPVVIAGFGAGTFPYSTPLSSAADGRCAMAYAIYSSSTKKHRGLTVVVTNDGFINKVEHVINLGEKTGLDTIPYETRWISGRDISVSYTEMNAGGDRGISRIVTIDSETGKVYSNKQIAESALHTYASGAAIGLDGKSAVTAPVAGGLARHDLESGEIHSIVDSGFFSMPWVFHIQGRKMLMTLRNPMIITTRDFKADIYISEI
ncbi:BNR-4 repeat-containing protein [Pseudomonas auratipiscis]|uniref:BNR-4 repeat-containing protein n=1 Tax=Pseudomonas auratipiscis TaxID=3115853 RepID=A0AB35WXX8_9PSED|nr:MULTISPECIES: BNR-4 repeat-containing protein [unclassified Pseudomonas]MEE1868468.1 BNR-4 repeat-containing protein [Pseudomonas sp. 120P]MEE1960857.1 BNR-4 repeat-containing protein [Pseudomonas sp. 119P]